MTIMVVLVSAALILVPRGGSLEFPKEETVRKRVAELTSEEQAHISGLWSKKTWSVLTLRDIQFIATTFHFSTKTPITDLNSDYILAQGLDSLALVEMVFLLEDLLEIEFGPPKENETEQGAAIVNFGDLLAFIDSNVMPRRKKDDPHTI
jgi:acyl carrier protein